MFKKENFEYDGMYLMYNLKPGQHYGNNEFVARFKYVKFAGAFKSFLIKNFTTDEYFSRYKAGAVWFQLVCWNGRRAASDKRMNIFIDL